MQLPEVTLGIVPGIGAMVVPYRRWPGAGADLPRACCGRRRSSRPSRAHELGIVDALADDSRTLFDLAAARVHALAGRRPPRSRVAPSRSRRSTRSSPRAADGMALSPTVIGLIEDAIREAAAAPTLAAALEVGYRAFGRAPARPPRAKAFAPSASGAGRISPRPAEWSGVRLRWCRHREFGVPAPLCAAGAVHRVSCG